MQNENNVFPKRLAGTQIAYLLHEKLPEGHYVGGSDDLRCLLPLLNLSNVGDDAFILIRPLIHSMPLYLCMTEANKIVAYLGDSQGWQWRYYPTRDIARALHDYFPNIKIVLPSVQLQSREYQYGCPVISIETLLHIKKQRELFIRELTSIAPLKAEEPSELSIVYLQDKEFPESLKVALENSLGKLSQEKNVWQSGATFKTSVLDKAIDAYKKQADHISLDNQSSDYINNIHEWQNWGMQSLLPSVMASPVNQIVLAENKVTLKVTDKHQLLYGNSLLWTTQEYANGITLGTLQKLLEDVEGIQVFVDTSNNTITYFADDEKNVASSIR